MAQFFGDSDIPTMFREFGRPVTIGAVTGVGIPDLPDEGFETSDGPNRGIVIVPVSTITVQTTQFPDATVDDAVTFDGKNYTVRERLQVGDGALTKILLGD